MLQVPYRGIASRPVVADATAKSVTGGAVPDRRRSRGAEPEWVEVPGGRVPVVAQGDPCAPVVVAVPGLSDGLAPVSDPRVRRALPAPPPALDHLRTVVLSHRHPVAGPVTTAELADDLVGVLDAVSPGRPAVLVGHSMGGMVAQHAAARAPERVAGLVVSASRARAGGVLPDVVARWESLVAAGDVGRFLREALEVSYTGTELLRRRMALRVFGTPQVDGLVERHAALSYATRTHDATGVLGRVTAPALVLAGDLDPLAPPDAAVELAGALPDARVVVLDGVAHGFPEQARDRVVAEVGRLLERLGPPWAAPAG
jgi:pimeloyl-ACP methyl ester carboxylesterase